jgi:disulfide bond formation protein DsbB
VVDTIELVTAVLSLVAAAGAILLVAARLLAPRVPAAARIGRAVVAQRTPLTLAVGGVSMLGSLYFSEVADYVPCRLCWFQRIAMYPIALVALVALLRRDRNARWYLVPMASIGTVISTYHYLIERGVLNDSESCALFGPSCADVWFEEFGFVTLAFMALAGFVAVIVLNTVSFDRFQEAS